MPKVKSGKGDIAKSSKKDSKRSELSAVKDGRVKKPAQTPKAKSKEIAKSAVASHSVKEKLSKKAKKVPTPEPESSSSDASDSEDDETSSSSASSDEEVETKTPAKTNGAAKAVSKADSDESSDADSDSSEDDSESEVKVTPAKANGVSKTAAKDESESEDGSSDESESSEDESEDEKPAVKAKGPVDATKLNGTLKKVEGNDSSDEDSDDSATESNADSNDSDSDDSDVSDSDEAEDEALTKKRKAEAEPTPSVKKTKTEDEGIKNLFVGNLSWNIDEEWLSREFTEFGEITGCRIITDKNTGKAKGFGYVEFATAAAAKAALEAKNGVELDGRAMNIDFSTPRSNDNAGFKERTNDRAKRFGDQKSTPSDTIFVGNISFDATNDMISEAFQEYGTITRVSLPTDQETGAPKGFGYVGFSSVDEAQAALEALNGADIAGRAIRLDFATPRSNDGGSFRGGSFGRGGGRGRGGFGDRGGRGGRGRGGFGDRGGRGGGRGGRGGSSYNRGGFGDFKGTKMTF